MRKQSHIFSIYIKNQGKVYLNYNTKKKELIYWEKKKKKIKQGIRIRFCLEGKNKLLAKSSD